MWRSILCISQTIIKTWEPGELFWCWYFSDGWSPHYEKITTSCHLLAWLLYMKYSIFLEPGEFDDTPTVNLVFSNSTYIRMSLHQWMNNMTGDVPPTMWAILISILGNQPTACQQWETLGYIELSSLGSFLCSLLHERLTKTGLPKKPNILQSSYLQCRIIPVGLTCVL